MENAVAIAAIALAASSVAGLIWLAKFVAKTLGEDLKEHTKAAINATRASKEQIKASKEVLVFMKNLNGKLAKATIQTVKEQNVEHQTVQHTQDV
jgi:hypothetical protein